jgi:hypothetical protein
MRVKEAAFILCAALLCNGCFLAVGAGAGAGGYFYIQGELSRSYPAGLDAAWAATQQALADLSLEVTSEQRDGLGGRIEARRADETKVVLRLDAAEKGATRVRVRVGAFGDKKAAQAILEKISAGLKG